MARQTSTDAERPVGRAAGGAVDERASLVVGQLQRAAVTVRQHVEQTVLGRDGLTWTAFAVLRLIWAGDRVETRQVAADAGIAKATLTGVVDALVARDLVRRLDHPEDRRLVLLELTGPGRRLIRRVLPAVRAEEEYALAPLSPNQVAQLGNLLTRVGTHLVSDEAQERRTKRRR